MTFTIAPLGDADVETLCALARVVWRAHYPPIIGEAQTEYMLAQRYRPEIIRAELARVDLWWDTLVQDGRMVAYASSLLADGPLSMTIDKLYVHPERQRAGCGRALIEHTCVRARRLRLTRVVLRVNKGNASAIAAYLRCGFEIREAVVKDIGGGFVMDDYIMECRL